MLSLYVRKEIIQYLLRILLPAAFLLGGFAPSQAEAAGISYLERNAERFTEKVKEQYGEMINIAALLHDYDETFILAVIVVESEGKNDAVSHRGAQGLMQLMPGTARAMGAKNPKEPFQNILAGTKYLKELEQQYGFASREEALVAYNMGPSRARRWLSQYAPEDYLYVQKVLYVYRTAVGEEKERARIAFATEKRIGSKTGDTPRLLLTKPRSISLASFPMTLPALRRAELEVDN